MRTDVTNQLIKETNDLVTDAVTMASPEKGREVLLRVAAVRALLDYVEAQTKLGIVALGGKRHADGTFW